MTLTINSIRCVRRYDKPQKPCESSATRQQLLFHVNANDDSGRMENNKKSLAADVTY